MKNFTLLFIIVAFTATLSNAQSNLLDYDGLVGLYEFADTDNLFENTATEVGIGTVMCEGIMKFDPDATDTDFDDMPSTEFDDWDVTDGINNNAIAMKAFNWFKIWHGIPANGGGEFVNDFTVVVDVKIADENGTMLVLDASLIGENAYFIKLREKGYQDKSVLEIAQEMFSYADGATMSAKKDALVNIGGFLALNDDELAMECRNLLIVTEGFPTYGGLAGRDLEAVAQGLEEVVDEHYLEYRIKSVEYLGNKLVEAGVPIIEPPGGHAIYIDAKRFLPNIPPEQYPGQSIVCELYLEGGIRAVEIGSVMFGRYDDNGKLIPSMMELVRMAIPRRVYTQSHIDYLIEIILEVFKNREKLKGYKITYEAPMLRHFTARFEPLN